MDPIGRVGQFLSDSFGLPLPILRSGKRKLFDCLGTGISQFLPPPIRRYADPFSPPLRVSLSPLLLLLSASLPLHASNHPMDVPFGFDATLVFQSGATSTDHFDVQLAGAQFYVLQGDYTGNELPSWADIRPGQPYELSVDAKNIEDYTIEFVLPVGYRLYIDDVEAIAVSDYGIIVQNYSTTYTLFLEHADASRRPAGVGTGVTAGDISWGTSMGILTSGRSAGDIYLHEDSVSTQSGEDIFATSALMYATNSSEVEVIKTGPSNQTLRQVRGPQALADVVDGTIDPSITSGYEIRFYADADIGTKSGGVYTFTDDPYVVHKIENTGTQSDPIFQLTTTIDQNSYVTSVDFDENVGAQTEQWDFSSPGGLRNENRQSTTVGGLRTETTTVTDDEGNVATRINRYYRDFAGREQLWQIIEDPGGANLKTVYDYNIVPNKPGNFHRVKSIVFPDGNWVRYEYYDTGPERGRLWKEYRPYNEGPATPDDATDTNCRVVTHTYTSDWDGQNTLPRIMETTLNGTVTGKTEYSYDYSQTYAEEQDPATLRPTFINTRKDYSNAADFQTTVTARYRRDADPDFAKKLIYVKRSDETMTFRTYERGDYTISTNTFTPNLSGDAWQETIYNGTANATFDDPNNPGTDLADPISDVITGLNDILGQPFHMVRERTDRSCVIRHELGFVMSEYSEAYVAQNSFVKVADTQYTYDAEGNLTERKNEMNDTKYTAIWVDGEKTSETLVDGSVNAYQYDALGRVTQSTREGATVDGNVIPAVVTTYQYDAEERLTKVETSDGSEYISVQSKYSRAGLLKEIIEPGGFVTNFTYDAPLRKTTVTNPEGATRISERNLDGRLKSVTGTAAIDSFFTYSYDGSGNRTTRVDPGEGQTPGSSPRYSVSTFNWRGQLIKEEAPTFENGGTAVGEYVYHASTGNLLSISTKGGGNELLADTLFDYDELGRRYREGLDVTGDGALSDVSDDRVVQFDARYAQEDSIYWLEAIQKAPGVDAGGNTQGTLITLSRALERLTGTWTNNEVSETRLYDINDVLATRTTELFYSSRKISEKVSINVPGELTTEETATFGNGVPIETESASEVIEKYFYDALGRLSKTNDRTGDHSVT